ncbi:hypothetical protein D3C81_2234280 [compost metagenome]
MLHSDPATAFHSSVNQLLQVGAGWERRDDGIDLGAGILASHGCSCRIEVIPIGGESVWP